MIFLLMLLLFQIKFLFKSTLMMLSLENIKSCIDLLNTTRFRYLSRYCFLFIPFDEKNAFNVYQVTFNCQQCIKKNILFHNAINLQIARD